MKKLLLSAFALIFALTVGATVEIGTAENADFDNAILCTGTYVTWTGGSDNWKSSGNGDYSVVINDTKVSFGNGATATNNPTLTSGVTQGLPTAGTYFIYEVKADGYLYIAGKFNTNKNYIVWEGENRIPYIWKGYYTGGDTPEVISFDLNEQDGAVGDDGYINSSYSVDKPNAYINDIGDDGDCQVAVVRFAVKAGYTYTFCGTGTKASVSAYCLATAGESVNMTTTIDNNTFTLFDETVPGGEVVEEGDTVIVEECLYSTDFTEWEKATDPEVTVTTEYSNESLVFTLVNSDVMPDDVSNTEKFGDYEGCIRINTDKGGNDSITTSALKSITKVEVRYGTTGSNRGLYVYAKGDGDEDWVQVLDGLQTKNGSYTDTIDVDRENCELKFVSADTSNYVFLISLNIYGNVEEVVDLSDVNKALIFTPSDSATISSISSIEIDVLGDSLYLPMALNSADALGKIVVTDESGNIQVGVETDEYDYCKYSYKQGETLDGTSDIGIIIPLAETIVAAGTYTYTIPDSLIYWIDGDDLVYNTEQTITFTIDGTLEPGTFTISVSPDDEEVEELTELVVTIEGEGITLNEDKLSEIDIYARRVTTQPDVTMSDISSEVVDGNTVYTLTLATPVTDINTYQYTIPAGLFTDGDGNTSEEYVGYAYVTGPAIVHEYSAEPEDGSTVETLESITIICEDGMWWSWIGDITATKDGEAYELTIDEDNDLIEGDDDGANGDPSRMTIILNITEAGEYVITIPEGYFIVGSDAANSEEIILTYTVTGGETTGINSATLQATGDGKVYNLNGQRVSTPHNGIYILNGKKVLVK